MLAFKQYPKASNPSILEEVILTTGKIDLIRELV
jgi:hypothetical protein